MKLYEILMLSLQLFASFMLLRSCFYILRVRKEMKQGMYYVFLFSLIIGTMLSLYNLTDLSYIEQRFPFNIIYSTGSALLFYAFSREKKQDLFNITNIMKREYDAVEMKALAVIDNSPSENEVEVVTDALLDKFQMHKQYIFEKVMLTKVSIPQYAINLKHKFKASMLTGGYFKQQEHPDLEELLNVNSGTIINESTGEVYTQGMTMRIAPGERHLIKALERSDITAYLYLAKHHPKYQS